MTTSFFANRALVQETSIQTARALDTRLPLAEQLVALHTLQGELERLHEGSRGQALHSKVCAAPQRIAMVTSVSAASSPAVNT